MGRVRKSINKANTRGTHKCSKRIYGDGLDHILQQIRVSVQDIYQQCHPTFTGMVPDEGDFFIHGCHTIVDQES